MNKKEFLHYIDEHLNCNNIDKFHIIAFGYDKNPSDDEDCLLETLENGFNSFELLGLLEYTRLNVMKDVSGGGKK